MSSTSGVTTDSEALATALGYLIGAGSLALYTPILLRVFRQKSARGLTLSTWWLKLSSYACSDVYSFRNGYPLSTYVETLIISVEAALVLVAVAAYQRRIDASFALCAVLLLAACSWALTDAPPQAIACAQGSATLLNTGALIPQLAQNSFRREAGGYSPITAALACTGCAIRLFTTKELADGDPLLLAGFGCGLVLNAALLGQIVWYGVVVAGQPLLSVLSADFALADAVGATGPASAGAATSGRGMGASLGAGRAVELDEADEDAAVVTESEKLL